MEKLREQGTEVESLGVGVGVSASRGRSWARVLAGQEAPPRWRVVCPADATPQGGAGVGSDRGEVCAGTEAPSRGAPTLMNLSWSGGVSGDVHQRSLEGRCLEYWSREARGEGTGGGRGDVPPAAELSGTCHTRSRALVRRNPWVWGRVRGSRAEHPWSTLPTPPRGLQLTGRAVGPSLNDFSGAWLPPAPPANQRRNWRRL